MHFTNSRKAGVEQPTDEPSDNEAPGTGSIDYATVTTSEEGHASNSLDEDPPVNDDLPARDKADAPVTIRTAGLASGAAAVVCAGLGLTSLTGTWLGDIISERQRLIGQFDSAAAASQDQQIEGIVGAAWHSYAAVNGSFALVTVLLAALVLIGDRIAVQWARITAPWVRITAWGGLVLGVLGLLMAGGVWLDLLAPLPQWPQTPTG
ncbi:hypothetical protein ACFZAV_43320 [Streptomyces sp. NPDC008343]|uniref:hypothetical protein n=1 Tax=Streptomyces sp. NPDC008343 TaxID=3364828 RepID=UPI0036EEDB28